MRGFEVLEALKAGKRVTRTSWGDNNYIAFDDQFKIIRDELDKPVEFDINFLFTREWEIYKKYVPFLEAMEAFEEGATVRAWEDDSPAGGYIELDEFQSFRNLAEEYPAYGFKELSQMKWTIEN